MLDIFGVEGGNARFESGGDDETVVKAVLSLLMDRKGFGKQAGRRQYADQRVNGGFQIVIIILNFQSLLI